MHKESAMLAIEKVWFDETSIFVQLNDQRVIDTPIMRYPNLSKGTKEQLYKFDIWSNGTWLHWEELDEDLSLNGLLQSYENQNAA